MPIRINHTEHDHIPETFSIEALKEGGFTDQEIAALSEGDDPIVEEEAEAAAKNDPLPDDPDAQKGVGNSGTADEDDEAPSAAPPEDDPEPAKAQEPDPAAAAAATVDPFADYKEPSLPDPVDVTEHQEVVTATKAELTDLMNKYDDGELTADEFTEQQSAIIERQAEARAAIKAAEKAMQSGTDAITNHWYDTLDKYKGLGTEALWSQDHLADWDRHLRTVTGQQKYADLTLPKQIEMAHRLYAAEYEATNGEPLGIPLPGQAAAPDPKAEDGNKNKREVRTDEREKAPQTLSGMNSDTQTEVEESVFSNVDRKIMSDPIRAEEMVASFSDEQMQRFLAGA